MSKLISVSDVQARELDLIRDSVKSKTGREISYKLALEIYASRSSRKMKVVVGKRKPRSPLPEAEVMLGDYPVFSVQVGKVIGSV
jgi:hypothetical protein